MAKNDGKKDTKNTTNDVVKGIIENSIENAGKEFNFPEQIPVDGIEIEMLGADGTPTKALWNDGTRDSFKDAQGAIKWRYPKAEETTDSASENTSSENTSSENTASPETEKTTVAEEKKPVDAKATATIDNSKMNKLASEIERNFKERAQTNLPGLTELDVRKFAGPASQGINLEFTYTNDAKTSGFITLTEFGKTVRCPQEGDYTFGAFSNTGAHGAK